MATKDELLAFCETHDVDADASMLKADIEAAITAAGYDPQTLEEPAVSDEPTTTAPEEAEIARTSSDASFATYREATADELADDTPAPGRHVVQERGEPTEGGGTPFSAGR